MFCNFYSLKKLPRNSKKVRERFAVKVVGYLQKNVFKFLTKLFELKKKLLKV